MEEREKILLEIAWMLAKLDTGKLQRVLWYIYKIL